MNLAVKKVPMEVKHLTKSPNTAKQLGVALVTVMLIVALCSIIASQMTMRLQTQMQRSINISFNQQAYWYAMGAEAFAKRVLLTALKDEPDVVHLEQIWAGEETSYPVDFGNIGGKISDLQSCLNLNAFHPSANNKASLSDEADNNTDPGSSSSEGDDSEEEDKPSSPSTESRAPTEENRLPAATVLENLLLNLNIEDVGQFEAEAMVNALTDWFDSDSKITGNGGAEDSDYESREFPYLAANSYMASVNELRLVEHFTPAVILAIQPYVCVLPQNAQHQININTLSAETPELLQALLGSNLDEAQELLSARDSAGYTNINDFYELPEFTQLEIEKWQRSQFVVDSEFFNLDTNARFNNSYFSMSSIIKVTNNKKVQIISRTIGRNK